MISPPKKVHGLCYTRLMAICEVDDCDRYSAKHLCRKHLIAAKTGRIAVKDEWGIQLNPMCTEPGCPRRANSRKLPSLCGLHQEHHRNGIDPSTLRPKRRWGEKVACCEAGCTRVAVAKGCCGYHYSSRRREEALLSCRSEEGHYVPPGDYCRKHKVRAVRGPLPLIECAVDTCTSSFRTTSGKILCKQHNKEGARKGLTNREYLGVLSIRTCQACGGSENLAVDHSHGHHDSKDKMCIECIRGRLCSGCNTALGLLGESEERIMGLVTYLREHKPGYFKGRV